MYVKLVNGTPGRFPYNMGDLKKEHPNTSFPTPISASTLAEFDVYEVTPTPTPAFDSKTHKARQWVAEVNGTWLQTWELQQLPEDLAAANIRAERNRLLTACDWTQLADSPLDADAKLAWQLYRETRRMVPEQTGFPWNVEWPPLPGDN